MRETRAQSHRIEAEEHELGTEQETKATFWRQSSSVLFDLILSSLSGEALHSSSLKRAMAERFVVGVRHNSVCGRRRPRKWAMLVVRLLWRRGFDGWQGGTGDGLMSHTLEW